jgi:hypothetical protein
MSEDTALTKAKAKAKANGKPRIKAKERGAYKVVVNDDKTVSVVEVGAKGNGASVGNVKAEAVPV